MKETTGMTSATEERALALLGSGLGAEIVANALGVSPSRISQLLSQDEFAAKVSALRFENISKHNTRDAKYDSLEDQVLEKLENTLPLVHRPMELTRILTTLNSAKRRGSSTPEGITQQSVVVNLVLPTQVINKFTFNANNQVVQVGEQNLVTIQSGTLLKRVAATAEEARRIENEYERTARTNRGAGNSCDRNDGNSRTHRSETESILASL